MYFECSRSGYYNWIKGGKLLHNKLDMNKIQAIQNIYNERKTRGRRQVMMLLKRRYEINMCLGSVHRYMKILGLSSIRKTRKKWQKKEEQKSYHTFPNVLNGDFYSSTTLKKWATDITYLFSKDGTEYLSCIKDLCDKSIISYAISSKNDLSLTISTLEKAAEVINYHNLKGIIIHSDQGHQYTSKAYHSYLSKAGMIGSMSRKGNPTDNASIESFFSLLKSEGLEYKKGLTKAETRKKVEEFIEYYNYERPQYNLKELTPMEYKNQL